MATARLHPASARKRNAARPRMGSRGRPEQTRSAILDAAILEFSQEGVAGARIDAIARHAGVNKALLYYYFQDKEALYGAVLDRVFGGLAARVGEALDRPLPPRERLLAYAGAHFDYVASSPLYPRLVHSELMRSGRGGSPHIPRLVQRYLRPTFTRLAALLQEGMDAGEFRRADPRHTLLSVVAIIIFYFTSVAISRHLFTRDPMAPAAIAQRRSEILAFIAAAVFTPAGAGRGRNGHASAALRATGRAARRITTGRIPSRRRGKQ